MSPAGDYNRCYVDSLVAAAQRYEDEKFFVRAAATDHEPEIRRTMEDLRTWHARPMNQVLREYGAYMDKLCEALGVVKPPLTNRHNRQQSFMDDGMPGWMRGLDRPRNFFGVTPDFVPSVNRLALVPLLQTLTSYPDPIGG